MLSDLTTGDFQNLKSYSDGMRACHDDEFVRFIDPELIHAMYRGRSKKWVRNSPNTQTQNDVEDETKSFIAYSRLFQESNTILPQTYYQNPSPIVLPKRSTPESAALMSALLKHYMIENNAKRQNQEAVLSSYFFGIGWKKMGYRTVFIPRVEEPETKLDPGIIQKAKMAIQTMMGNKPDNNESGERPELVDYETLFNDSENPMNVYLDHKASLWNGKFRNWRMLRTLHDLENYGDYEQGVLDDLESRLSNKFGSRFDKMNTDLHMNELHVIQRNGLWILTWIDEYEKPMRYEKSNWQGKGFCDAPLILTNEPFFRYPTSHMKVASQVQVKLDKLATLFVELMARSVNLVCVNEKALSTNEMSSIEKNLARGILRFKGMINAGDISSFSSGSVPPELKNLMMMLQQNITEVLGGDSQLIGGNSTNDTLGQDELARVGTKIRQSGMQDKVRDFMIDQFRKEAVLLQQYSNAELELEISGKDYQDPSMAEKVEPQTVRFMSEDHPIGARAYLQGEFDFDINVEECLKPDTASMESQYDKILAVVSNPAMSSLLLQDQCRIRGGLVLKERLKVIKGIGNVDRFIEKLNSTQIAAIQTQNMMMQGGIPSSKPQGVPGKSPNDNGVSQPSSEMANA